MSEYKKDLFWANMPSSSADLNDLGFFKTYAGKMNYLYQITTPYCIWSGVDRIEKLEKTILPSDTVKSLNQTGFQVYLYEPLFQVNSNEYKEYADNSISIEMIDSIKIFAENNNLTNVQVFACDFNIQKIQHQYPTIKLYCLDIFLRSVHVHHYFDLIPNTVQKKFWCGNWRYTTHRHIITAFIIKLSGNYSWYIKCNVDRLLKNNWFNFDLLKESHSSYYLQILEGCEKLETSQFSIDQNIPSLELTDTSNNLIPGALPQLSKELILSYKECFCAIVNETTFATPFSYISEKTLYPINSKMPFIVVGGPYSLTYLKSLGFKTFDHWWDESYDTEEDPAKRLIKVLEVIEFINSKSIYELQDMYSQMAPVLCHNRQMLDLIKTNRTIL